MSPAASATTRTVGMQVPGDHGLPVVGYTLPFVKDRLGLFRTRQAAFGPVFTMGALGKEWICVLSPDGIEEVFRNADRAFASGPSWSYAIGPFFDRGLMLLDFEEHHRHRRIMQQAFTSDRIQRYADAMHTPVATSLDTWKVGNDFAVYPALKELTLNIATQLFMGGAPNASAAEMAAVNKAFIDCVQAGTSLVRFNAPFGRWRAGLKGRVLLERFLREYLPERRATASDDLFSALCHAESEEGERFTDDDVINHMIFLLMAAHDTSTITLSTMMQYLGQHPEWQDRCRAEVLASGEQPTVEDQREWISMDLVMREAMRLVTPVPVVLRHAVKDTQIQGHAIAEGSAIMLGPVFTHHDPNYWPNPETFDPGRFSDERREDKVHRYAWQPFGGGVHKCLGMHFGGAEVKTVMAHLLRRYEWSVDPDYVCPMDQTSLPFPSDGQPINLHPR